MGSSLETVRHFLPSAFSSVMRYCLRTDTSWETGLLPETALLLETESSLVICTCGHSQLPLMAIPHPECWVTLRTELIVLTIDDFFRLQTCGFGSRATQDVSEIQLLSVPNQLTSSLQYSCDRFRNR